MVPWAAGPTVRAGEEQGTAAGPGSVPSSPSFYNSVSLATSKYPGWTHTFKAIHSLTLLLQGSAVLEGLTMESQLQGPPL